MKYIHNKAFPYPVLSQDNGDFTDSAFQASIQWRAPRAPEVQTELHVKFVLSDENMQKLIKAKKAEFAIEILCTSTYTRRMVKTYGEILTSGQDTSKVYSDTFEFNKGDFYGEVTTNCYILSKKDIDNYVSENFNPDYEGASFRIEAGSVLAVYPPREHYFDTEPEKPIGSFFKIVPSDNISEGQFNIGYDDDNYVSIYLSKQTKSAVDNLRKQSRAKHMLWPGLYFPAILEVLHTMHSDDGYYQSKPWFVGISRALEKSKRLNPKIKDVSKNHDLLKGVQQLLSNPLDKIISHPEN